MSIVPRFRYPVGYDPCNPNVTPEKKQKLLFVRPWNRFRTNCNVLNSFTPQQLKMRTKAEILQYRSKHVQHSKTEKYALAARKHYVKRHYTPKAHIDENGDIVVAQNTNIIFAENNSALALEFNNENCGNGQITKHKSSASDVPGPSIDLFLDPSVPLINYGSPQRVYRVGGLYNVNQIVYDDDNYYTTRIVSNTTVTIILDGELNAAVLAQIAIDQSDPDFKNPKEIIIGVGVIGINSDLLGGSNLTIDGNPKNITTFSYKKSNFHNCSYIGDQAFFACKLLTTMNIPNSVLTIGKEAFDNCLTLPSLIIPDSVTSIGIYMAYFCPALTSVIIGNSLHEISEGAFDGCSNLAYVRISPAVIQINTVAFRGCSNLETIEFVGSGSNKNVLLEVNAFQTFRTYNPSLPVPLVNTTIVIPPVGQTYVAV